MSTLIVRDATLAVNGAPETRGDTGPHLIHRVHEVLAMEDSMASDCIEVLVPSMGDGEECDTEVLMALTVIGLAKPALAQARDLNVVAVGRRLAARLEEEGDANAALDLVERLREQYPGHGALERDADAILGRLGMVQDLAERYFQRAQQVAQQGNAEEAIGWLREVLAIDETRADAQRMIRDLKLANRRPRYRRRTLGKPHAVLLVLGILLTFGVLRELEVAGKFEAIPPADLTSLSSTRARLESVETFMRSHLPWHGIFTGLRERSELRVQVQRLEVLEEERLERERRDREERAFEADLLQRRAVMNVEDGRFEEALQDFNEALETAPEDWPGRAQVEKDVAAVEEYMAETDR